MVINLDIDNELIQEALKLSGHSTKHAVVEAALQSMSKNLSNLK